MLKKCYLPKQLMFSDHDISTILRMNILPEGNLIRKLIHIGSSSLKESKVTIGQEKVASDLQRFLACLKFMRLPKV